MQKNHVIVVLMMMTLFPFKYLNFSKSQLLFSLRAFNNFKISISCWKKEFNGKRRRDGSSSGAALTILHSERPGDRCSHRDEQMVQVVKEELKNASKRKQLQSASDKNGSTITSTLVQ